MPDSPLRTPAPTPAAPGTPAKPSSKTRTPVKAEEASDVVKWWEQSELLVDVKRGGKKWDTLSHNGVMFAPPYEPHGIPIKYEGAEIKMPPAVEEVATMFAVMRDSPYYKVDVFRRNFMHAFREVLDEHMPGHNIKRLELIDFDRIYEWFVAQRAKRLAMTREEKKAIKAQNDAKAAPYLYCLWDGRKEQVGNFKIEPPGLFRGRGKHPRQGCLKKRIMPEDVTINIGEGVPIPECPPGHHWKAVIHDNTVTWLCMWKDTVTDSFKYVMLAANSTVKGISDREKFEKARRLHHKIEGIRESSRKDWRDPDRLVQQRAVAMYFIDKLALRVGNEKGEDEADTVGCCSLRCEHVAPLPIGEDGVRRLHFDFLGKDSIRYVNDVEVDPTIYDLIVRFRKGKEHGKNIFDLLEPMELNEHLKNFMPGLSAKVFRTYNASVCLENELRAHPVSKTALVAEKLVYFNQANTKVAVLCNHQKTVSKTHDLAMSQLQAKAQYAKDYVARLEECIDLQSKNKDAEAYKKWYEYEDRVQLEWLEKYGTPEELEEYKAAIAARESGAPAVKKSRPSSGAPSKPRKSGGVKAAAEDSDDDVPLGAVIAKTQPAKRKTKREDSDSDDELIGALAAKPKAKAAKQEKKEDATSPKPAAKKGKAVKAESDSDDDVPLGAIAAKPTPKAAPKRATAKQEQEDSDEDKPLGKLKGGSPDTAKSPTGKKANVKAPAVKEEEEKPPSSPRGSTGKAKAKVEEDSDDEKPLAAVRGSGKAKAAKTPAEEPAKASPKAAKAAAEEAAKPSPKGASPKGASPKGASPKGASPTKEETSPRRSAGSNAPLKTKRSAGSDEDEAEPAKKKGRK